MISNQSKVNQWGQIRGGRSGATSTHHQTRRGGALVYVAAAGVEHIVRLGHALELLSGHAGGCSLCYSPFGNLGAFIRPRIGLTVAVFDLVRVFLGQATVLRKFDSNVCRKFVGNWSGVWGIHGFSFFSEIPKSLRICSSVSESVSVQANVNNISGYGGAGCGNVAEHSICRVFRGHLLLTCVEMYNIFCKLDKIYYKFLHLGCIEAVWLIDRRVEVGRRALLRRWNSNICWKSVFWFHRL